MKTRMPSLPAIRLLVVVALHLLSLRVFATPESSDRAVPSPSPRPIPQVTALNPTPHGFIPNVGQLRHDSVRFILRDGSVSAHFTEDGFVLWTGRTTTVAQDGRLVSVPVAPRWELLGARPVQPVGGDAFPHTVSFFRGKDPSKWHTHVPAYRNLQYPNVLDGVDLRVETRDHGFEYTIHVQPHATPDLRFRYDGITGLETSPSGDLTVRTASGAFTESRPVAFQRIEGEQRPVSSAFEVVSANEYRIVVGDYDKRHELVIDPVLDWSTFWGGSQVENSRTLKVAPDGGIIVAGHSFTADLPESPANGFSTGAGQNLIADKKYRDGYVAKFTPDGTQLIWSGYLGADGATETFIGWKGLAVDHVGDVYVSGYTDSPDFPATNPHAGGLDAFITKIQSDGSGLVWSRFLGGTGNEFEPALGLDASGNLFVAGYTSSPDLPTSPLAFQPTLGGSLDGFVALLSAASGAPQWCSYLGGSSDEHVVSVAATADGGAVVFGDTASSDFPTVSAFQPVFGGVNDAFVTKVAGDGTSRIWSTFLGGADKEHDMHSFPSDNYGPWAKGDVIMDSSGNVLVAGQTHSADFPTTPGVFQGTRRGNDDAYITKFSPAGGLIWSSYLGGTGPSDPYGREEIAWGLAVNAWDEIFVGGWSQSIDFPTTADALKPSQPTSVRYDGFLTKLTPSGTQILYSTYIGGSENNDVVLGVAYDNGNVFVTGWATAASFPITAGAFQTACASCQTPDLWAADGFVMRFLDAFIAQDGFDSGNYSAGQGDWVGGWTASGDTAILTSSEPHSGGRHVRLRTATGYLKRVVQIPPASISVRLGYWAKVSSFETSDRAHVLVSADGATWTTLRTFSPSESDSRYRYYEDPIPASALTGSQVHIAFDAAMNANNDQWYLDDIRVTGTTGTVPPVANAGPDQSVTDLDGNGVEIVNLDGSGSFDPDGGPIASYQWTKGATLLGTTVTISPSLSVGDHTIVLTVTDDEGATSQDTVNVTVNPPPPPVADPLHVGDLDRSSANSGKNSWKATVVITLHDNNHNPVPSATVSVQWGGGASGTASASTGPDGTCTFVSGNISKSSSSATLTVTGASHATLSYSSAANHDPDGDSNGTSITVPKP